MRTDILLVKLAQVIVEGTQRPDIEWASVELHLFHNQCLSAVSAGTVLCLRTQRKSPSPQGAPSWVSSRRSQLCKVMEQHAEGGGKCRPDFLVQGAKVTPALDVKDRRGWADQAGRVGSPRQWEGLAERER